MELALHTSAAPSITVNKRNYGIDAFRILAMMMVVTLHVLGGEGLFLNYSSGIPNGILWFFEAAAYPAVNCYALITGYVCVTQKNQRYSRIIDLVSQAFFYSVIIQCVAELFHRDSGSFDRILNSFVPSDIGGYWYFTAYCGLFFIIPLLNKIILNISKRMMLKTLIGAFLIFSAAPYLYQRDLFKMSGGYSMVWLAVLYFFGAYLRLYGAPRIKTVGAVAGYLGCTVVSWIMETSAKYIPEKFVELKKCFNGAFSYTAPLMVLAALFLAIAFMNYQPKRTATKIIAMLSPYTFGVYLFHLHPEIWEYSKLHLHKLIDNAPSTAVVPITIAVIIAVYLVCTFGDFLRVKLYKLLRFPKLFSSVEKFLGRKLSKVLDYLEV